MKMNRIYRLFAALVMGSAFMVSCKPDTPVETATPEFPQMTSYTVTTGSEVELSVTGNMDWTVSVPEESLQWYWIKDGSFKVDRISGKADEPAVVVIGVSATEEFDSDRSCEVTMTMGGESKVIAKLVRPAKEKTLTLYTAVVVDGEIQFVEDGSGYQYGTDEAQRVDLIWTGSDFRLPLKVDANFDWTVKTPEWAVIDVPETSAGTVDVNVYGVPSEYPLEASEGKIQFMYGDTVVKEYAISIPGCQDKFSYSVGMALSELDFDFNGQIKTPMGYVEGPVTASIYGTSGTAVFAVELVDGKYDIASATDPYWLTVADEPYDHTEGADVLQTRNITISASLNEGDDRQAVIFFLPPTGWTKDDGLFTESLDAVKEEYRQYALPVIQHSSDQEFVQMLSNASDMAAGGASFAVSEDQDLYTKFGQTRYAYELVYTKQYARDNARMMFTSAVTSSKIFDEAGEEMAEGFLSITLDENNRGGVIDMVTETLSTGYVVLYGTTGNVLAVIKCTFDPSTIIGEVADVAFIGESEMYAPMVGASLEHLTEGSLYNQYREGQSLVYHLTYTMENMPMRISIPNTVVSYTVNPYVHKDYFRVNNIIYDEVIVNGRIGGIELIDGGIDIYMEMPEGRNYLRGNIIFSDSEGNYTLVLICTLDLR